MFMYVSYNHMTVAVGVWSGLGSCWSEGGLNYLSVLCLFLIEYNALERERETLSLHTHTQMESKLGN